MLRKNQWNKTRDGGDGREQHPGPGPVLSFPPPGRIRCEDAIVDAEAADHEQADDADKAKLRFKEGHGAKRQSNTGKKGNQGKPGQGKSAIIYKQKDYYGGKG